MKTRILTVSGAAVVALGTGLAIGPAQAGAATEPTPWGQAIESLCAVAAPLCTPAPLRPSP